VLEQIDLEKVFRAARQKGFSSCEIFVESFVRSQVELRQRLPSVRLFHSQGLSLRASTGSTAAHLSTTHVSTEGALALLSGTLLDGNSSESPISQPSPQEIAQKRDALLQFARKASLPEISALLPSYEDRLREFEVAREDGFQAQGTEEEASFTARWQWQRKGETLWEEASFARASIAEFWKSWEAEIPLLDEITRSLRTAAEWPVPQGNIPILWSSKSLSKILLTFFRAFEGDFVLRNLSFLNDLPSALQLHFGVRESEAPLIDNEGSEVRDLLLFENGQAKAFACDRFTASQLQLSPTGHSRRSSFENAPTVGLWSPCVLPENLDPQLESRFDQGLWVKDVKILQAHPASSKVLLELSDAVLVHHGERGETVEKIQFDLDLLDFLPTLQTFSASPQRWGFHCIKQQQRLLVQVQTAAALSETFSLPGTVPPSYYW
jgi:predicted Zn-dependent protease